MEQFVAAIRVLLEERRCAVRVPACRRPGEDGFADAVVPARYPGTAGWPLPTGGWRTIWQEAGCADVIVANNAMHPLSAAAILAGRRRGVPGLMVIHGSGEEQPGSARSLETMRGVCRRTAGRLAVRHSLPVSISRGGVAGVRREYGVPAAYLPYPLPELPAAAPVALADGEELRVMWTGRLAREKDPLLAVEAIGRLRATRAARLEMYGDGPLRPRLEAQATERSWLTHGSRPVARGAGRP